MRLGWTQIALLLLVTTPVISQVKFSLVTPAAVQARVGRYKGNDNEREATLLKLFSEAGCPSSNLSEQPVAKRKQPNVLCVLPGSTTDTIVVGAHFDHVSEGSGVVDNWSGASLLPSLYESLLGAQRKHTYIFIGFTGEEAGEIGSHSYVDQLSKDEVLHTQLMVNLDTLGLGPSKVWTSRSDKHAVQLLGGTAHALKLPLEGMDLERVGDSDEESFIKRSICTITVHSLTPQTLRILHSPNDSIAALHLTEYYDSYRLVAAYLSVLDTDKGIGASTCPLKPLN